MWPIGSGSCRGNLSVTQEAYGSVHSRFFSARNWRMLMFYPKQLTVSGNQYS